MVVENTIFTDIPSAGRVYGTGRKGGELVNNISGFPYSRFDNTVVEIQQNKAHEFIYAPRIPNEISGISDTALVDISVSSTKTTLIPFRASTDNMNGFNIAMKLSHDGYSAGKIRAAIVELDLSEVDSTTGKTLLKTGKIIPTDEYLMDDSTTGLPWVEIDFGASAGSKIVQKSGLHDGATYPYLSNNDDQTLTYYAAAADLPNNNPAEKPFMIEMHIGAHLSNPAREMLLYHSTYGNDNVNNTSSTDGNNQYCDMTYTALSQTDVSVQAITGKSMGKKGNFISSPRMIPGRYYAMMLMCEEDFGTTAGGTAQVSIYGSPKSLRAKRNQPYIFSAWNNRTWKGRDGFGASTTAVMSEYCHGWVADAVHAGVLPASSVEFSSIHTSSPNIFFQSFSNEKCEIKSTRISGMDGEMLTDGLVDIEIVQSYDVQRCLPLGNNINTPESFEYYDEFHNVPEMEHADLFRIRYKDGGHTPDHIHFLFQIDHKDIATFCQTYL